MLSSGRVPYALPKCWDSVEKQPVSAVGWGVARLCITNSDIARAGSCGFLWLLLATFACCVLIFDVPGAFNYCTARGAQ